MNNDNIIEEIFKSTNEEIVSTVLGVDKQSFIFQLYNYPKAIVSIKDFSESEFYVTITIITNDLIARSDLILGEIYSDYFIKKLKIFKPHISLNVFCPVSNKILNEQMIEDNGHPYGKICFYFFDSDFKITL